MMTKPWLWPLGAFPVGGEGTGEMDNVGKALGGPLASVVPVGTAD